MAIKLYSTYIVSVYANKSHKYSGVKVLVGLVGLLLSVVLHELFHVFMHWGEVVHIGLFPGHGVIAEVAVSTPGDYDLIGEEIAAYMITLLVILATAMIICKIHDATDKRSASQILFARDSDMQRLSTSELLELASRAGIT